MKISEQRLKKAEQEITNIVNDLFKRERGLHRLTPDVKIYIHDHQGGKFIYNKLTEYNEMGSGGTWWRPIGGHMSKLQIFIFG